MVGVGPAKEQCDVVADFKGAGLFLVPGHSIFTKLSSSVYAGWNTLSFAFLACGVATSSPWEMWEDGAAHCCRECVWDGQEDRPHIKQVPTLTGVFFVSVCQ